jgi:hypothetical protein
MKCSRLAHEASPRWACVSSRRSVRWLRVPVAFPLNTGMAVLDAQGRLGAAAVTLAGHGDISLKVLFGMQNRIFDPYLAAIHRIQRRAGRHRRDARRARRHQLEGPTWHAE